MQENIRTHFISAPFSLLVSGQISMSQIIALLTQQYLGEIETGEAGVQGQK